jgi:hypothetical protein
MTTKYIITAEAVQTIGSLLMQLPYKDAVKAVQALESIEPFGDAVCPPKEVNVPVSA